MSSEKTVLRRDEEFVLGLRSLYESYGYKKFKMSKFEKYDLYLENKSFLRNGNIVTVTDPKGRLLALKPDITLSIVKNIRSDSLPEKFYYNENVYISDAEAGEIKETTQVGLEYFGELDVRAHAEILLLAAESLSTVDENYKIALSHMGFVSEILDNAGLSDTDKERVSELISSKNGFALKAFCKTMNINQCVTDNLCGLIDICGSLSEAVAVAEKLVCGPSSEIALNELKSLSVIIDEFGLADKFMLDFSIINDMNYYNGLVFQGFVLGVPKTVLSGGRYDNLVHRFGCNTSAIGFAISIDMLSQFHYIERDYDYDIFMQYSNDCAPAKILSLQRKFAADGFSCIALNEQPKALKYAKKVIVDSNGSVKYE